MKYGKALKLVRVARGLSQKELALRADMDASYISLLEGEKRVPTVTTLGELAKVLDIPLHLLVLLGSEEDDLRGISSGHASEIATHLLGALMATQAHPDEEEGE